jgi:hypothetical protein
MTTVHSPQWVPTAIRWLATGPVVDWCHLGELRFTASFFDQTIGTAMRHPFNLLFGYHTPLAELMTGAGEPELKLSGFIFHMSRCGSTVVSQMLAALPSNVVLSEPTPIDHVLRIPTRLPGVPEDELVQCLRAMMAALGRRRHAGERDLFVKLDAWHVLLLPLLRRAFPGVPWIFLYRDPLEVMASLTQSRPTQMFPNGIPPTLLGIDPAMPATPSFDGYAAFVLERYCAAAIAHHNDGGLLIEYGELPGAVCGRVLDHFGVRYGDTEVTAMRKAAEFDAKRPRTRFQPDGVAKRRDANDELHALAKRLAPLYARLEALRLGSG